MLVTIKYCLFPPSRSQNWKLRPREEGIPSAFWGGSHEGYEFAHAVSSEKTEAPLDGELLAQLED